MNSSRLDGSHRVAAEGGGPPAESSEAPRQGRFSPFRWLRRGAPGGATEGVAAAGPPGATAPGEVAGPGETSGDDYVAAAARAAHVDPAYEASHRHPSVAPPSI